MGISRGPWVRCGPEACNQVLEVRYNIYMKLMYAEKRKYYEDLLGGVCALCGKTDDLHFDHIDPRRKNFKIGGHVLWKESRIIEELKLCQLLCSGCHRYKTKAEHTVGILRRERQIKHGTTNEYNNYKCRCHLCTKAWTNYILQRRRDKIS